MNPEESFDQILASVGDRGRYQKLLIWLFLSPLTVMVAWVQNAPIFMATVPDHWCHVEGKPSNLSLEEWKNWTIPWIADEGGGHYSSCYQYDLRLENISKKEASSQIAECQHGWDYDRTWYDETMSTRNDWVCQDSYKGALWLTVGEIGRMVGMLVFNRLPDIIGRKFVIVFEALLFTSTNVLRIFLYKGWPTYFINFLSKMIHPSLYYISFVLVTEQIENSWRVHINALINSTFTIGLCLLSLFAWLTRSWTLLAIVTSAPFLIVIAASFFIEESSRWLASRGRISDAYATLCRIAKVNKKNPPDHLMQDLRSYVTLKKSDQKQSNLLEVLRSKLLLRYTFLGSFSWLVVGLVYNTLNYNVSYLGGNQFLNFFLLGIFEFPSSVLGWVACQTIGRRLSSNIFYFLGAVSMSLPIFAFSTKGTGAVVCSVAGKLFINGAFFCLLLQMTELFPTSHRVTLIGFTGFVNSITVITAPYITYSSLYWPRLPYVVMMLLFLGGVMASLFLPETLGFSLPQTIADTEAFFGQQPFWSYLGRKPNYWVNITISTSQKEEEKEKLLGEACDKNKSYGSMQTATE